MHALVHLRQLRRYERQSQERLWEDDGDQPKAAEVHVGLLGLGVLGTDAAMKLRSIGFTVAGWSMSAKSLPGVECFSGADGLKRLLAKTDMLVVLLPLTGATRGLIDASLIAQLKQGGRLGGPILINAGRGGLQVEADILAALDSGRPQGRFARRVRTRAAPRRFAPLGPPGRLRQPAQRGDLHAGGDSPGRRPADRGIRARRAAQPPGRSAAGVLKRGAASPLSLRATGFTHRFKAARPRRLGDVKRRSGAPSLRCGPPGDAADPTRHSSHHALW